MKLRTDPIGRTIGVGVVVKGQYGWMIPLSYELQGVDTCFSRLPHGHFGVQVASKDGADVLVFLNGKQVLAKSLTGGIHILEVDGEGRPFEFLPEGQDPAPYTVPEQSEAATNSSTNEASETDGAAEADESDNTPTQVPQFIPTGNGALFVVARLHDDAGPGIKPPHMEWPFTFALNEPADHDEHFANNFSRVIQAPPMPDIENLNSTDCDTHEPKIVQKTVCLTCGRH